MNMSERRLSKKVSVLVVTALLLGTAGLATAAATGASDTIMPMMKGKFSAFERSLSRHSAALAVHVGEFDGENRTAVEGAVVRVYDLHREPCRDPMFADAAPLVRSLPQRNITVVSERDPVAMKQTDADGRAVFELRPGCYAVDVQHDDAVTARQVVVSKATRVGVVFDLDGNAEWFVGHRRDVARDGAPVPFMVRVGETDGTNRSAVANATVTVYKVVRSEDGPTYEEAGQALTGANGQAMFHLPPGPYKVAIMTPSNMSGEKLLRLHEPTGLYVMFDADGNAHFRELHRDDRFERPHRPMERPTDRPTERPTPTRDPYERPPRP